VRRWATDIGAAASNIMATFETDYGYPPA